MSSGSLDNLSLQRKQNIFGTALNDYLFQNVLLKSQRDKLLILNDLHLKQFSTIFSNLPFDIIKKSFENLCSTQQLLIINKKYFMASKTTPKKQRKSLKIKKSDSLDTQESISSSKSSKTYHKRPNSAQSTLLLNDTSHLVISNSNQIVIHVCDEAKRLKQDFTCPRELLMAEMKYFSYNLNVNLGKTNGSGAHAHSSISQSALSKKTLDEIDISVHCDINIFDWLMRYVKRNHPHLNEKTIAGKTNLDEKNNFILYNKENKLKYLEPKLEFSNCISILLSSDFLLMEDLIDKCIVFIAKNLGHVLQVPCVMSGISEPLLVKLAACVHTSKLLDVHDRKDKLKTKLYQRKLEFMFDLDKFKSCFTNSKILNEWKRNKFCYDLGDSLQEDNYLNFLYELENDASSLFKCKLCSRLMTKKESFNLKCQLAILSKHGEYIYLHVPDEKLDLTKLLLLFKEKLKSWQNVYWFVWCLIKMFKCKNCNEWFRLLEMNKCRLNSNTSCNVHDAQTSDTICTCIHSDHVIDIQAAFLTYSKSLIVTEASPFESPELKFNKYIQYILEIFEKNRDLVLNGPELNNEENTGKNFVEILEDVLKLESQGKDLITNVSKNSKLLTSPMSHQNVMNNYFIDSITGKQIALVDRTFLNMIKVSNIEILGSNDLKSYLNLVNRIDPVNIFNCLEVFSWLRSEFKMKWELNKPIRFNQDNQREDDLKRFREISSFIIKNKLSEENSKPLNLKSPLALLMSNISNNNVNLNIVNNFNGGIYCRVENQWKHKI
ncbi:unnamed protein product [Brachionus calyciflorus]|uniref:SANT and BTB domain-containing protein n=1 Tax=Brachionus calyciflorus TaxID=104777 RepID=A0A814AMT1_9BILA|nr:unnamed protein product [Brachionus calyciflorus]